MLLAATANLAGVQPGLAASSQPLVNAVDPHSGTSAGGTAVAIFGSGFTGATGVKFGSASQAQFFVADDTRIFTSSLPGNGVVDVTVWNGAVASATSVADEFTYLPPGRPAVQAIDPRQGTAAGGTNVSVFGSGFSTPQTSVDFGTGPLFCAPQFVPMSSAAMSLKQGLVSAPRLSAGGGPGFGAPCQILSDGQLAVNTPAGNASGPPVHVTVSTPNGTSSTSLADQFNYVSPLVPVVNAVGPNHGTANGSTQVSIFGTGLAGATKVTFGTGTVSICGPVAPQRSRLVRVGPSRLVPVAGPRLPAASGPGCFPPSGNDNRLDLPTPPGTANSTPVDVVVTTGAGSSATNIAAKYTYTTPGPPRVDAVDPNHGSARGGIFVGVLGQGFTGATAVYFGSTKLLPCPTGGFGGQCFNQNDDADILVSQSPPGTANTTVDVKVEVGALVSLPGAGDKYKFDTPKPPVIYAIDPSHGSASGGTNVSLFGGGFSGTTDVQVGSTHLVECSPTSPPACFFIGGDENLFLTMPPGTVGTATVTVTTPTSPPASTNFHYDPPIQPEVDAVSPNSGPSNHGTQAWITGKGLGGATNVTVGGQSVNFFTQFGTDTVLQITVPPKPSGSPSVADVVVTSGAAGTSPITPNDQFTYTAAVAPPLPTVSAASPSAGPIAGGTMVFISGHAFFNATGVSFGTTAVASGNWHVMSDNLIQATSPGAASASTVDVVVTNPTGPSAKTTADQFSYTASPPPPPAGPYVNAVNPNQGSTVGGDFFTIIGGHFTGATMVAVGTQQAGSCHAGLATCFAVNDDNHINVSNSPPGSGTVDVTVTGPGGTSPTSSADLFSFVPPGLPTVDALAPNQGPTFGGGQAQIFGSNLSSVDTVKFGGTSVPPCNGPPGPGGCFGVGGNNTIFVNGVPPAAQSGAVDVTVHNVTGSSAAGSAAAKYTYFIQPAPIVSGVNPNRGPSVGGTQVYITGQHMLGANQVSFGQNTVQFFGLGAASDSLVFVMSPPGTVSAAPVDVTVSNPTGTSPTSAADHFTYEASPLPVISAVSPNTGPTEGGTSLLISGSDLGNVMSVQFGTNRAFSFFQQSPNVISVSSPPTATSGAVHVTVTTAAGQSNATAADLFTYTPTGLPVVDAVSPASGPSEGGTKLFITGQNIGNPTNVTFGGTSTGQFFPVAENVLQVFSPPGAASTTVDVIVTTPSGSSAATNNDKFSYTTTSPPKVLALGPSTGPAGTNVLISGTDLGGVSSVLFGSVASVGPTFTLTNQVVSVTAPGTLTPPSSPVTVKVTAAGGTSTANPPADQFTYTPESPPAILAISPNNGPAGTVVDIIGEHLGGATAVYFGATAASAVFVRSDNLIRVNSPAGSGSVHVRVQTTAAMLTPMSTADLYFYPGAAPVAMAALPAMANDAYGGYTTVAYIKNVGTGPASLNIKYYDGNGAAVGIGDANTSLPANATWIVRQDNGNSLPLHGAGSALVSSTQPIAAFVNEFAPSNTDATSYTAIQIPDRTGTTLYAPAIASGAYGGYTTGLGVINAGDAPTNVTVTYRGTTGATQSTQIFPNVNAHAYLGIYSGNSGSATDANLPSGFAGTATITSSGQKLAAVVNEVGVGSQFSSYDAVAGGSTSLQVPVALNKAFGGYYTGTAVQDVGGLGGNVTLHYFDQNGVAVKTVGPLALAANGYLGIYQGDAALGPPESGNGYTAVLSSTDAIASIVNEVAPPVSGSPLRQSTSYNTLGSGLVRGNLALVESGGSDGWSTGLGIMNTGTAATTVMVRYSDLATGAPVGTPQLQILQPNAFWGVYQPAAGLPAGTRATAVVTASGGGVAVICNESNAASFMSYNGQ